MPRIARKNYDSSYFHIIVQGYERNSIFNENFLKEKYLKLLINEMKKFNIELLAYCLMDNHVHILIYCKEIQEMSLYMKNVNTQYAMFYNKYKNRVGYVFRDRFLSEPIQNEKHLYQCLSYIHFNPVNAEMVAKPSMYQYSSFNDFINKTGIVTDSVLIKLFGSPNNYTNMFQFIHLMSGEGLEYKDDYRNNKFLTSKEKIKQILKDNHISNFNLERRITQKDILKKMLEQNIAIYHIEKVLKINHRTIKELLLYKQVNNE